MDINARLKSLKTKYIVFVYVFLALIIVSLFVFMTRGIYGFLPIIPAVVFGVLAKQYQRDYISFYKENVVKTAISACDFMENLTYDEKVGISSEEAYSFGAITEGNGFSSGDRIAGTYRGVDFSVCDVEIEDRSNLRGDSHTRTILLGQWITVRTAERDFTLQIYTKDLPCAQPMAGLTSCSDRSGFFSDFIVLSDYAEGAEMLLTEENKTAISAIHERFGHNLMIIFRGGYVDIILDSRVDSFDSELVTKHDTDLDGAKRGVLDDLLAYAETARTVSEMGGRQYDGNTEASLCRAR